MIRGADTLQTRRNYAFVHNHSSCPSWPALAQGFHRAKQNLSVGPEEAQTRHDQAPKVTVETQLALACTGTAAFGPAVETRLERTKEGKHQDQMVWHQSVWNPVLTSWPPSSHRSSTDHWSCAKSPHASNAPPSSRPKETKNYRT